MKRFLNSAARVVLLPLGVLLIVAALAVVLLRLYAQQRTAARIRIASPAGINSLEKVRLGGVDQWISLRGHDGVKPVLLFLHGGPGFPQMPFSHLNAELEREFVVVEWDQRGAGKSYSSALPGDSMRVERFVADAP